MVKKTDMCLNTCHAMWVCLLGRERSTSLIVIQCWIMSRPQAQCRKFDWLINLLVTPTGVKPCILYFLFCTVMSKAVFQYNDQSINRPLTWHDNRLRKLIKIDIPNSEQWKKPPPFYVLFTRLNSPQRFDVHYGAVPVKQPVSRLSILPL